VVLGSGLNAAVPELKGKKSVKTASVPGFPPSTVKGHSGMIHFGDWKGGGKTHRIAVLQGRFHFYEGHSMAEGTLPIRALHAMGLKTLVLTSAVGSMRKNMKPGDLCVLSDHINMMGANPLRGCHTADFGEMFPDLAGSYDAFLRRVALKESKKAGIKAREGVYLAAPGPSYETPAEIRAYQKLGGDVVGMSVVPEVIVARQLGIEVLGLSWIANMAAGISEEALAHEDVLEIGRRMAGKLKHLLDGILSRL